jgi:integrase/recombinase XerC
LFDLGLRRAEAVALNMGDLDLPGRIVFVTGKGRCEKSPLTLPEPTAAALRDWISVRGIQPGPLFPSVDKGGRLGGRLTGRSVHRLVKRLGLEIGVSARPHGLRHSSITTAIQAAHEKRIPLQDVQRFSRHANIQTLLIYDDARRDTQGALASLVAEAV